MTELTKIEASGFSRRLSERIAVATIVALLIVVQTVYVAKHPITFAAIVAPVAFGIIPP
jgi:hypothetical protein